MTDYKFNLSSLYANNPVMMAERSYQRHSVRPSRRWLKWVYRLILYAGLLVSFILFGGLLIAAVLERDPTLILTRLDAAPTILAAAVPIWQISLLLKTIQLSANSVAREKEAQTWELLVLSGIDARRIVRGKWWATIRSQWRDYVWLGLLRLGANSLTAYSSIRFSSYYLDSNLHLPHPVSIMMGGAAVFVLTLAGLGLTAACGVMGSTLSSRGLTAVARAVANQIVLTIGPAALAAVFLFFGLRGQAAYLSDTYSIVLGTALTLVDNGSVLASSLMSVWSPVSQSGLIGSNAPVGVIAPDMLAVAVVSVAAFGLLTWLALWLAERRAISQMALPVGKG